MATNLGQKELKLIVYLLGINSKDILTCKLLCKSWNFHLSQILPPSSKQGKKIKKIESQKAYDDEKEEEKSYSPLKRKDKSSSRNNKNSSRQQTNDTPYSSKSA